jgi:hypothetical protein
MVNPDYGTSQAILTKTLTRGVSTDDQESNESESMWIHDGKRVRKAEVVNSVNRKGSKRNGGLTVKSHS